MVYSDMTITQEVWHGDALQVATNLPSGINCVITDPPYGVNFVSRRAITPSGKKWVAPVENDSDLGKAIGLFLEVMDIIVPKMAPESDLYVFTRWDIVGEWIEAVRSLTGVEYKMMLVWDKGIPGMGDIDANWGCGHEIILYCKKGRRDVAYRRSSIIAVDKVHPSRLIHPTEKPVPLMEKFIEMSTQRGGLVVDPFAGSGATLVAAQRLGRSAIGIELSTKYVSAIEKRLSDVPMDF